MPKLPTALEGKVVATTEGGFPAFFQTRQQRVLTSNIWSYLASMNEKKLSGDRLAEAQAYLDQADEFFATAAVPGASQPVLYYYSFLNLSKVFLLHRGIRPPPGARHGLEEGRYNLRDRMRLTGQKVRVYPRQDGRGNFNVAGNLLAELDDERDDFEVRVVDCLRLLPSTHRTYSKFFGGDHSFCPAQFAVLKEGSEYWARVTFDPSDKDVKQTLGTLRSRRAFQKALTRVKVEEADADGKAVVFETASKQGRKKAADSAIRRVAEDLQSAGLYYALKPGGYSFYFCCRRPGDLLPQPFAAMVAMFYLGSIARYRPLDYRKVLEKNNWLLGDFLETEPIQFVYGLASLMAEVDVVLGQAIRRSEVMS